MIYRQRVYHALVTRNPKIEKKYNSLRKKYKGKALPWLYLIWANAKGLILIKKRQHYYQESYMAEGKKLPKCGSESKSTSILGYEKLVEQIEKFDVVSFDVFDTLLFRPFGRPDELFFAVGHKLRYMDFKRIRIAAEKEAREEKFKAENHYEVTLTEIYEIVADKTGLDKTEAMLVEWEAESQCCFANPYMQKVIEKLKEAKTRIIITSDTYFTEEQVRKLLENCGYSQFASYYISSDIKMSKSQGDIYDEIKRREGENKRYIHVGDNHIADIEQAKKHGVEAYEYKNVNELGEEFRTEDISTIVGGIYRGMVNSHIYNGLQKYSQEYEYGYIYGGLFVTGYCQFIHDYVQKNAIDKTLFLSRDGDILLKAYEKMYPQQKEVASYTYWSRLAALKIGAKFYKSEYLQKLLYDKVNQECHLQDVFAMMDIEDISQDFYIGGVSQKDKLTSKNVDKVKQYIEIRWSQILAVYEKQSEGGKHYYSEVIKGAKKVVIIDAGWAGTGAIFLKKMVESWNVDCKMYGLIAGTLTTSSLYPDANETFIRSGELTSYMFSQSDNRDLWSLHSHSRGHNLLWELLMTSTEGSFQGFYLDTQGDVELKFRESLIDASKIREIHLGILDFVGEYTRLPHVVKEIFTIEGRDAYAPMLNVISHDNQEFVAGLTGIMDKSIIC